MTYYSGRDLARSFRVVRKNTLQIAHDIPEARYDYRATPDTRSIAETLRHLCANLHWAHRLHAIDKGTHLAPADYQKYVGEANAYADRLATKDELIRTLEADGEMFAHWLEGLDDRVLSEIVTFPPPLEPSQKTRFEMLLGLKEHEMHHRGQLMLIERLLGIVPHLTRQRPARTAAAAPAPAAAR